MGDTANMWGDMLGLGPIVTALKDPQFFVQVNQLFHGLIELDKRTVRIEAKLDAIMERIGVDSRGFDDRPAIPSGNGPARGGPATAASGADDDGAIGIAAAHSIA